MKDVPECAALCDASDDCGSFSYKINVQKCWTFRSSGIVLDKHVLVVDADFVHFYYDETCLTTTSTTHSTAITVPNRIQSAITTVDGGAPPLSRGSDGGSGENVGETNTNNNGTFLEEGGRRPNISSTSSSTVTITSTAAPAESGRVTTEIQLITYTSTETITSSSTTSSPEPSEDLCILGRFGSAPYVGMKGHPANSLGKFVNRIANSEACAGMCTMQPLCESFSYSARQHRCHLFRPPATEGVVNLIESQSFSHYTEGVNCVSMTTAPSSSIEVAPVTNDAHSELLDKRCHSCRCAHGEIRVIELWGAEKACKCTCRPADEFNWAADEDASTTTPTTSARATTSSIPSTTPEPLTTVGSAANEPTSKSQRACEDLGWSSPQLPSLVGVPITSLAPPWASCAASEIGGGCPENTTMSRPAAEARCLSAGARLCTQHELQSGIADDTGCGLDNSYVWTSEQCGSGHQTLESNHNSNSNINVDVNTNRLYAITLGGNQRSAAVPRAICATESVATLASVRCCADSASTMPGVSWIDMPLDAQRALLGDESKSVLTDLEASQNLAVSEATEKRNATIIVVSGSLGFVCLVVAILRARKRCGRSRRSYSPASRGLSQPILKGIRRLSKRSTTHSSSAATEYDNVLDDAFNGSDAQFSEDDAHSLAPGSYNGPSSLFRANILQSVGYISGFTESTGSGRSCGTILEDAEDIDQDEEYEDDILSHMTEDGMFVVGDAGRPGPGGISIGAAPSGVGFEEREIALEDVWALSTPARVAKQKSTVSIASRIPTMLMGGGATAPQAHCPVEDKECDVGSGAAAQVSLHGVNSPAVRGLAIVLPPPVVPTHGGSAGRDGSTPHSMVGTPHPGLSLADVCPWGDTSAGSDYDSNGVDGAPLMLADIWADDDDVDPLAHNGAPPSSSALPSLELETQLSNTLTTATAEHGEYLTLVAGTDVPLTIVVPPIRQGSKLSMASSDGANTVASDNSALWDHCYDVYADVVSFKEKTKKKQGSGASLGSQSSTGGISTPSSYTGGGGGGSGGRVLPAFRNIISDSASGSTNRGASWLVEQDAMLSEAIDKRRSSERAKLESKLIAAMGSGGSTSTSTSIDADTHV